MAMTAKETGAEAPVRYSLQSARRAYSTVRPWALFSLRRRDDS
jgi:hypothetical protein